MDEATLIKVRDGIKKADALLDEMQKELIKASGAGVPVEELRKRYDEMKASNERMKMVYGV